VAFKQIAPEQDIGFDVSGEYEQALKLFPPRNYLNRRKGQAALQDPHSGQHHARRPQVAPAGLSL
jgi:hypothetical protein